MKRKMISAVIALSLTIGSQGLATGIDYNSNVIIDNNVIKLDQIHRSDKQQLMFPIREITEKLNYKVSWNNEDRTIRLSKGKDIIKLKIGESKVNVNEVEIALKTSPIIKNGSTLIPIEFFDKALKLNLGWDNDKNVFKINNFTETSENYFEKSEDEVTRKKIDNYMNLLRDYQNFQGSLLVGKDNKLIINKGYGLANVEQSIPNQSQTKFAIGSVTKQFTAMAIMQLTEKNLIKVEDKVSKYMPELKEGKNITIHNLLTHTSGLVNYTDSPKFFESDFSIKDPMNMLNLIKDKQLQFKPGKRFDYSNTNYLVLGMIVEKITGNTLEDYLKENILDPLDMKNTGVNYGKEKVTMDATPYSGFIEVEVIDDTPILTQAYGAGNMYSTVEDLYRWDRALKTEKLVSYETLNKMFTNHIMIYKDHGYGYGVMIDNTEDGKRIWHGGNTFGFTSNLDRYVDKDLTVIALSNKGYVDIESLTETIKDISLNKDYDTPEKLEAIKIEDKDIYKKYTGMYKFVNGTYITINQENDQLYAQITGQPAFEIFPQSDSRFFAKMVDVRIEFSNEDEEALELTLEQLSQKFTCERVESDIKPLEPAEVDTQIYKDFVGEYELLPGVIIDITNEGEKIYAKLTGQDKYEIFPLSENKYFYKVVDAKISFERDKVGNVIGLILKQNSVDMKAPKNM